MKIEFNHSTPKREGQYLFKSESGCVHLITVVKINQKSFAGYDLESYLANSTNRRNITAYLGKWTDALEF